MTVPYKRCGSSTLMWWMSFGEEIYLRFQSLPSTDLYFDPLIRLTNIGHWWTDNAIQLCIHWQFYWVHVVGWLFKSLTHWPWERWRSFYKVIFQIHFQINFLSTSYKLFLRWVPQDPINDRSTLVQLIAWCSQTSVNFDQDPCRHMASLAHSESI